MVAELQEIVSRTLIADNRCPLEIAQDKPGELSSRVPYRVTRYLQFIALVWARGWAACLQLTFVTRS
eukprot:6457425-Amphidinium_carterae.1